jgi:acetoacetyl-CoA synthetase
MKAPAARRRELSASPLEAPLPAAAFPIPHQNNQLMSSPRKLWEPSARFREHSHMTRYAAWLRTNRGVSFDDYKDLWQWSVKEPAAFWESLWDYFQIRAATPYARVMSPDPMPYTRWFEGSTLNYAEHVFRWKTSERPAILFSSEDQAPAAVSWQELERQVASLQAFLTAEGVKAGDRIAAYLPNIPEATAAMLAALSLGAVWSSCSPDFGAESVLDRFGQIQPRILFAVDGYRYNGKSYDRRDTVAQLGRRLPSVQKVVLIPRLHPDEKRDDLPAVLWEEVMSADPAPLSFTPVPFSHPIWVLYSSGTTGRPKAITHSHGGMLLEHLKYLCLHNDVHPGDTFFWYTTTGWMMWNFVQASLLAGATIVLYDGSPVRPEPDALWKLAGRLGINHFGTSAPYIQACMKAGLHPRDSAQLSRLRSIGVTGAPLPPEGFDYVYRDVKQDVWLCSMSGGTDICTAWVGGNPWRPVWAGEIQCRCLGCSLFALDEKGQVLEDQVGEMTVTVPMPCMPVFFWDDPGYTRYKAAYFEMYPGKWRHGDWVRITPRDGVVILGRSDTTLNRQGVRIGTAEIYRAVDQVAEVADCLIVNLELPGGGDYMPLFVAMRPGIELTEALKGRICATLRSACSPRHVPDEVIAVPDIPYTNSGKKMEAPVKRILAGVPPGEAVSLGTMKNPGSLDFYAAFARRRRERG